MNADTPVSREELERVVHEYRHLREEHRRARSGGRTRRRIGARLDALTEQFERLLAEAAVDEETCRQWRAHLHRAGAEPAEPAPAARVVFRGRSDTGSVLLLRARADGTLDAAVDGATIERFDQAEELASTVPGFAFKAGGVHYAEIPGAPPAALEALRVALESGAHLERAFLGELSADGIVDRELNLTPRGRRLLALDTRSARHAPAAPASVSVNVRGPVPRTTRKSLELALVRAAAVSSRLPLRARGSLVQGTDPAVPRPVLAKAQLDFGGQTVQARVTATTIPQALALLEARLRKTVLTIAGRRRSNRRLQLRLPGGDGRKKP